MPLDSEYPSDCVIEDRKSLIISSGVRNPKGVGFPILNFKMLSPYSSILAASSTTSPRTS